MMKRLLFTALFCLFRAVAFAQTGTLSPEPYLTILDADGATVSGACVWTTAAGTSTPVTTYSDKALSVPNTNPVIADSSGIVVIYLVPAVSYKYVIEQACTPPAHGVTIRTQDNIDAVGSVVTATDITGVAGEAFAAGTLAYLSDGTCVGCVAGHWYKADNTVFYSAIGVEISMTPAAIGSGQTGTFRLLGRMTGLTSLSPGAEYFVGTAGGLTTTPGSFRRHVGQADTTTSLVLDDPAALTPRVVVLDEGNPTSDGNSSGTQTMYTFTVPAFTLGTYRTIRFTATGTYENGSAGTSTLTAAVLYGGQTMSPHGGSAVSFGTGTTLGPMVIECLLTAQSATGAQFITCTMVLPPAGIGVNPRIVDLYAGSGAFTVDSTAAQTFVLTLKHSVADVLTIVTIKTATLELIGK